MPMAADCWRITDHKDRGWLPGRSMQQAVSLSIGNHILHVTLVGLAQLARAFY